MIYRILGFILLFFDTLSTVSKYYIQKTAITNFLPLLKLHHIVLINQNRDVLAIDFTPINQTQPKTLLSLALGKNVPAEIRVRKIKEWNMDQWNLNQWNLEEWNLEEWINAPLIDINTVSVLENINKKEWTKMNLYRRNCQHFSKEFITTFDQV